MAARLQGVDTVFCHALSFALAGALARELAHDSSWLGGPGQRPLLVRVSGARHENLAVWDAKAPATDPLARLITAVYMTDWEQVQRDVAAVR